MIIKNLRLPGLYTIEEEPIRDERGEFSRVFCSQTFKNSGLLDSFSQINRSVSKPKGTLRGLHYQVGEFAEAKFVRVLSGAIYDVAVDVRKESKTYLEWEAVFLDSKNRKGFYLSPGFAHGILTLEEDTEIEYLVSQPYHQESERGLLWNDEKIGILWPISPVLISDKDQSWNKL